MLRFVLLRLAWMVPTLLGIAFGVFLLMDLAPSGRPAQGPAMGPSGSEAPMALQATRSAAAVHALEVHYGLRDPETLALRPVPERFARWLGRLLQGRLAGPLATEAQFRSRIATALPVTLWVGGLALSLALLIAWRLGPWLGLRAGTQGERGVATVLFGLDAVPAMVSATLLALLLSSGGWLGWFPSGGLPENDGSTDPGLLALLHHLALPAIAVAIGPAVVLTRLVRTGVAEAMQRPPADALAGWGRDPRALRRHLLRAGLAPCITQLGTVLPILVTGSLIVEQVFGLPGMGRLATRAVLAGEPSMVMAIALLVAACTLLALLLSDVLQRWRDPRAVSA